MFSVVIPLYNKAHTIIETLQSVLAQEYQEFEVVIVDDGSSDGGMELVERQFRDPRIRLIRQSNLGASAARNRGVDIARYQLIAFLDGDDLWLPGYLTAMKAAAEKFPDAGLYCCAGIVRYPDGSGYSRYSDRYRGVTQKVKFFESPAFFSHTSSNIVRKSRFYVAGGFPVGMRYFEDQVLFHKVALRSDVVFCPLPLAVQRKGMGGHVSSVPFGAAYQDQLKRTNMTYAYWAELEPPSRDPDFARSSVHDLRIQLATLMAGGDYAKVRDVLGHVDPRLLGRLGPLERRCYPQPVLRRPSNWALSWHRVLWRSRGYPRPTYRSDIGSTLL